MDDDRALYRRWLDQSDAEAFSTLVRRHANLVHDVAFRVAGDRAAAEDALQEALLRLATDGTDRPATVGVRAWLARASIDRARNARRSDRARAARERAVGEVRKEAVVDAGPSEDGDAVREVEAALRRADGDDAAILTLRFRHGVEYGELAAILDVSEGAARVRVHRATDALRRDEALVRRDGPTIERALGGLPISVAPAASLTAAIDVAIGAAGTSGAAGAGAGASVAAAGSRVLAGLAALVPGGLAALVAAAIAVTGGVFVLVRGGGEPSSDSARPGAGEAARGNEGSNRAGEPRGAPLDLAAPPRGRAPATKGGAGPAPDSDMPTEPPTPPFPPRQEVVPGLPGVPRKATPDAFPRPAPASASSGASAVRTPPTIRSPRVRAELVLPDAPPVPIAIDRVALQGQAFPGTVAEAGELRIPTAPGTRAVLNVFTKDARALVPRLVLVVTEPVPDVLVARFPASSDPRLDPLVVEVLDAASGAPIAGAALDWQWPGTRAPTTAADSTGRILIPSITRADGVVERGMIGWLHRGLSIHARGFRSWGPMSFVPRDVWERAEAPDGSEGLYDVGLDQADSDAWRARGTWVVRLERLPDALESKTVRVLFEDGQPAAGAVAYVTSVGPARILRELGAAVTPDDIDFGMRRVGLDGEIEFGARSRTAIEVFVAGCPVGVFALTRDRWPVTGPREIRLAPLADVTVAIDGIPDGAGASWGFDPLGAARSLADGPSVPITWDDGFDPNTRDEEFVAATFIGQGDLSGDLKPGTSEIRFRYPVGWARPLHLRVGDESRSFVVKAPTAGPVRLDAHWGDLEDAIRPPR